VVLINKSTSATRHAQIHAPARASAGIVQLLRAPGLAARNGVTLGGQSFAPETTTGTLVGPRTAAAITSSKRSFTVTVPPASAALLTIPRSS